MIERARVEAVFAAQIESMVAAHLVVPEGELVWATGVDAGVDVDAVADVANEWARMSEGAPPSDSASFMAGFLTALRLVERSEVV